MADVFKVLNRNVVLASQLRIHSTHNRDGSIDHNPNDNAISQIQSPHIWRFGVRVSSWGELPDVSD